MEQNSRALINHLKEFITPARWDTLNKVLSNRTSYLTVVLEDIYQSQNASAVLRSCDCFGIQNVHIIENKNEYQVNPDVALGSQKWLTLTQHNQNNQNTQQTITKLKSQGYRIVATTPHQNATPLEAFDLSAGKAAILFGNELQGLSETALKNSDETLKISMLGFTESFNISVSAAIILYALTMKLRNSEIPWGLDKSEKTRLILNWQKKTIKHSNRIVKKFLEDSTSNKK